MRHPTVVAVACAVLATTCTDAVPSADVQAREEREREVSAAVQAEASTQPPDRVDLTVYVRRGRGSGAHLVPVVREVAVQEDLPRAALKLLLEGPRRRDGVRLAAPLPADTRVLGYGTKGDTVTVDLSADARSAVDPRPEHAVLAMAAVANTLTEFPTISRVRLTVAGRARPHLWAGWRVPAVLTRDNAVIGPPADQEGLPRPSAFRRRRQRIGTTRAGSVTVVAVRTRPRAGFTRVAVELAPRHSGDVGGEVPRCRARRVGGRLELVIGDVARARLRGLGAKPNGGGLQVRARHRQRHRRLRVTVHPPGDGFQLHTLSDPTRVVLDIRPAP